MKLQCRHWVHHKASFNGIYCIGTVGNSISKLKTTLWYVSAALSAGNNAKQLSLWQPKRKTVTSHYSNYTPFMNFLWLLPWGVIQQNTGVTISIFPCILLSLQPLHYLPPHVYKPFIWPPFHSIHKLLQNTKIIPPRLVTFLVIIQALPSAS